jgi:hypothetical protein
MLRQFAGLWLIVFGSMAAWRAWHGIVDLRTETLAAVAILVGGAGLIRPAAVRWIYSGWMIAAFPIGWTVSRLALAAVFYGVFTPIGVAFRLAGRDALRLRRLETRSYWTPKAKAANAGAYFRQS